MIIDSCYQMVGTAWGRNEGPKRLWLTMTLCDPHASARFLVKFHIEPI